MFTGIVEEMGTIQKIERGSQSAVLSIRCEKVLEGTQIGDSIAVNGVCLTVTSLRSDGYDADVMAETMNRSSLGLLQPGSRVNLERAMPADGRFGGHIVAGHVDGTGTIVKIEKTIKKAKISYKAIFNTVTPFIIPLNLKNGKCS